MLDPFTSLSLASSIVQILDFAGTLLERAHRIRKSKDGSIAEIQALEDSMKSLLKLSASLDVQKPDTHNLQEDGGQPSNDQRQATNLAQSCKALADRITATLQGVRIGDQQGKMKSLRIAVKLERNKSKFSTFERELAQKQTEVRDFILMALSDKHSRVLQACHRFLAVDESLGTQITQTLDETTETIRQEIASSSLNRVESLLSKLLSEAREVPFTQTILKSLSFDVMHNRRAGIVNTFQSTYEWIFSSDDELEATKGVRTGFADWLRSGQGVYWISGKAGSGKSTLMKFLSTHRQTYNALRQWTVSRKLVNANYFFYFYGCDMERTQVGLFRALLFEILRVCPDLIPKLCPERWRTGSSGDSFPGTWNMDLLAGMIDRLGSETLLSDGLETRFCFFIDGLDEYDGDHEDIVALLKKLASGETIKIVAASRPWNVFQLAFGNQPRQMLTLQELTFSDIHLYTEEKLTKYARSLDLDPDEYAYTELALEVTEKAQGVFLWVYLVVRELRKSLQNGDSPFDVRRRLDRIPPDLEAYFRRMFHNIEDFYRQQAAKIFLVCTRARDPLALCSFAELESEDTLATRFCSDESFSSDDLKRLHDRLESQVKGRCMDLLEVHKNECPWNVHFLHRTVRDFLGNRDVIDMITSWAGDGFDPWSVLCRLNLVRFKRLRMLLSDLDITSYEAAKQDSLSSLLSLSAEMEMVRSQTPSAVLDETMRCSPGPVLRQLCAHRRVLTLDALETGSVTRTPMQENEALFLPLCIAYDLHMYLRLYQECKGPFRPQTAARLLIVAVDNLCQFTDNSADQRHPAQIIELLKENGINPNARFVGSATVWIWFLDVLQQWLLLSQRYPDNSVRRILLSVAEHLVSQGAECATGIQSSMFGEKLDEKKILSWTFGFKDMNKLMAMRQHSRKRSTLTSIRSLWWPW